MIMPYSVFNPPVKEQVIEIYLQDDTTSQADMARLIGCSREAVRQACNVLGIEIRQTNNGHPCAFKECGNIIKKTTQIYCSRKCWTADRRVHLVCPQCGENFVLRMSEHKARIKRNARIYCSHKCSAIHRIANKQFGRAKINKCGNGIT